MGATAGGAVRALVDDAESVCRLCYKAGIPITQDQQYPDEIGPEDQMIRIGQISKQDLTKRGFSVQRVSLYSRQQALAEPARRERSRQDKGKGRAGFVLQGVLLAQVSRIHSIGNDEGVRVFNVYQSPNDGGQAHAEIFFNKTMQSSQYLKWRIELRNVLGKLQPLAVLPSGPRSLWQRLIELCQVLTTLLRSR